MQTFIDIPILPAGATFYHCKHTVVRPPFYHRSFRHDIGCWNSCCRQTLSSADPLWRTAHPDTRTESSAPLTQLILVTSDLRSFLGDGSSPIIPAVPVQYPPPRHQDAGREPHDLSNPACRPDATSKRCLLSCISCGLTMSEYLCTCPSPDTQSMVMLLGQGIYVLFTSVLWDGHVMRTGALAAFGVLGPRALGDTAGATRWGHEWKYSKGV